MDLPLGSFHWERRSPKLVVAAVAGFAAGAVLMVLDLVWSSFADDAGPWRTSYLIAALVRGRGLLVETNFGFDAGVVATALIVHYALGVVFGLILAALMAPMQLDATPRRALVTGAAFGLLLYFVNFYGTANWFPWLAELRGAATLAAHLVFGIVTALLYRKLQGSVPTR